MHLKGVKPVAGFLKGVLCVLSPHEGTCSNLPDSVDNMFSGNESVLGLGVQSVHWIEGGNRK